MEVSEIPLSVLLFWLLCEQPCEDSDDNSMFLIQRRGSWRAEVSLYGDPEDLSTSFTVWLLIGSWKGFPGGSLGKEPTCQCRRRKRPRFNPWDGKILWRRAWQPTPAFLPGEPHRQRSMVGSSSWGDEASDTTEAGTEAHTGSWTMKGTSVFSPVETRGKVSNSNDH